MDFGRINVVVLADSPEATRRVCGVAMVERTLRNLQRLRFPAVRVLASPNFDSPEELARSNWARTGMNVRCFSTGANAAILGDLISLEQRDLQNGAPVAERYLLILGEYFVDSRLLAALATRANPTLLSDLDPPDRFLPLLQSAAQTASGFFCGAALLTRPWVAAHSSQQQFREAITARPALEELVITSIGDYIPHLRRCIRPLWFPAPSPENLTLAETLVLDTAQNGVLDAPALVHAPVETWIVRKICGTGITPNQITFVTMLLGIAVAICFLIGYLWAGAVGALLVGLLDGVDGKLARAKVETTELGSWEHDLDYVIETSWWVALSWTFHQTVLPQIALLLFFLLFVADLLDRLAKAGVKKRLRRNLDDVAPIDRAVRFVGGRRNIYIWLFSIALILGAPAAGFVAICIWGAATAAVHLIRAAQITLR